MQKKSPALFLFFFSCAAMIICSLLIPEWVYLSRPWSNLGFIFLFSGLAMVRNIQNLLKQHQTEINTFKPPKKFVTTGLFRYSRNPIYLGFTMALFGVDIVLRNFIAFDGFLAFLIAVNLWYIIFQEAEMEKQFGQDYIAYKKKVGHWF
jgi:protein-S-isoprenylcysteine O-methyltransferase Ste14